MRNILNFSEDKATVLYHTFLMLCYFTPIPGAIVADTYLGKFKLASILYIAIANTLINWLNLQNNRNPIVRVRLRKRLARRCGYSKFPSANVRDHLFSLITNFKLKLFYCLIIVGSPWRAYSLLQSGLAGSNLACRPLAVISSSDLSKTSSSSNSFLSFTLQSTLDLWFRRSLLRSFERTFNVLGTTLAILWLSECLHCSWLSLLVKWDFVFDNNDQEDLIDILFLIIS